jgi:hypothetical protein
MHTESLLTKLASRLHPSRFGIRVMMINAFTFSPRSLSDPDHRKPLNSRMFQEHFISKGPILNPDDLITSSLLLLTKVTFLIQIPRIPMGFHFFLNTATPIFPGGNSFPSSSRT